MLGLDPNAEKPYDSNWIDPGEAEALRRQRFLISVIGLTAILLPPALILIDTTAPSSCFRNSLSHYYYSQRSGVFFVMTLAFIGTLLSAYQAEAQNVRRLAVFAGISGLVVAVFPTEGAGCTQAHFNARMFGLVDMKMPIVAFDSGFVLFPGVGEIHYGAAFVLFSIMFYFCAVIFRRVGDKDTVAGTNKPLRVKTKRNRIYAACAFVIAAAMIVMGLSMIEALRHLFPQRVILYGEWAGLFAFGVAWLVKGRVFNTSLQS